MILWDRGKWEPNPAMTLTPVADTGCSRLPALLPGQKVVSVQADQRAGVQSKE